MFTTTGLPNNGRTQYFNFQYDSSLSQARGLDLVTDVMNYCDADLSQLAAWFSGRQLDMSPPINVSFTTVATDADGSPTDPVGGGWMGAVAWPLQVTISIGEFPMGSGTPTMLARYILVEEVSEMYMRAFNAHGPNPWFRTLGEGNKGEGLSKFLGAQFLLSAYPRVTEIPWLRYPPHGAGMFTITDYWLNSARDNQLEVNDEDITPDPVTGCATLFLFFLHDQLGFRIEDIINAGGGHLSNVYENLTHDSATNAWGKFSALVNSHYPHSEIPPPQHPPPDFEPAFTPQYDPPLDSVFPVSDLTLFSATPKVSWVRTVMRPVVTVGVDHPAKVPFAISITSTDPTIIQPPSVTFGPSSTSVIKPLTVLRQAAGFVSQVVTLTASYAGRTLTTDVTVVSPDLVPLPGLNIAVDRSDDPCKPLFVEGAEEIFVVTNLFVFPDQNGLSFSWSVSGATPDAPKAPSLRISTLPTAGTTVTISVAVTNAQGLHATGTLTFHTVASGFKVIDQELRCRLNRFKNLNLSIPEWTSTERGDIRQKRLEVLDEQLQSVARAAESLKKVVQSMTAAR
ncbi:MAG: hypothetical protein ACXVHQ_36390 [Solirubrobacteraceae bacterium]